MMSSLRAEMESSFDEFKRNSEVEKQGMEEKLHETLMQWEALQSRKADMEAKVGFLGVALSASIAGINELESVVDEMKMEMLAARKEENQRIEQVLEIGYTREIGQLARYADRGDAILYQATCGEFRTRKKGGSDVK